MSLLQLRKHRKIWSAKPVLARVYACWFDALLSAVPAEGRLLEIGAGAGFLSEYGRKRRPGVSWITSDLLAAPWNHMAADAQRLPIRSGTVDAAIGLDVLHHLSRPGDFLAEAGRILRPGGHLALVEPWITPFSYPVYRFIHHERCSLWADPWDPFDSVAKDAFDGDAAVPRRIANHREWGRFGLEPPRVQPLNAFAYLLSLGFQRHSLLPARFVSPLIALDRWAAPLARVLAMRAFLVWTKAQVEPDSKVQSPNAPPA